MPPARDRSHRRGAVLRPGHPGHLQAGGAGRRGGDRGRRRRDQRGVDRGLARPADTERRRDCSRLRAMRAVFLGTPEFAVPSLRAVLQRHDVPLAVTQPDRRAGRGLGLRRSAVGEVAAAAGVPLLQPERVREPAVLEAVRAAEPDILVVAAYGQILPPALLEAAPHGALNVHASLLPRWRGASPVTAAILAGDDETGVSIMRMDPGLDTGPVALRRGVPIAPEDTTGSLTERLAEVGAEALVEVLEALQSGRGAFQPQPPEGVTHAPRVRKSDG